MRFVLTFGRTFLSRNEFRTIIPGGGTGQGTLFMAEQLNHTKSETVYIDFSIASAYIAQARSVIRRVEQIIWVIGWIENIPQLGLGKFDLVFCTGVLHHLKNPQNGLNILKQVQIENGGANFMVYGKYGRTGIYQIQDLMRAINRHAKTMEEELINAKHVLKILPEYHWFHDTGIADHKVMGDIGIYDMLLNKRDVSYSVPDLYEWLWNSGLHFIDFSGLNDRIKLSLKLVIRENSLYKKIFKMAIFKEKSIAELVLGEHNKQEFYASKNEKAEASADMPCNVLFAYGSPLGFQNTMFDQSNYRQLRNETYVYVTLGMSFIDESTNFSKSFYNFGDISVFAWPFSEFSNFVIISLTKKPSKPKSVSELISSFKRSVNSSLTFKQLEASFKNFYSYIKDTGLFLVKRNSVGVFPKTCCFNQFIIRRI